MKIDVTKEFKMKKIITLLFISSMLAACTTTPISSPTIASTKNYDLYNKNLILGKKVTGKPRHGGVHDGAYQESIDHAISRNPYTVALINVKDLGMGEIEGTEVIDPTLGNCAK